MKMKYMYNIAGISRQGLYTSQLMAERDALLWQRLRDRVNEVRIDYPHSSARKIHYMLGINEIGINRFERFVSGQGLSVKRPSSFIRTTYRGPFKYPNLVNGIQLNGIDQLWVSDLTYFLTPTGTLYIVLIMDVYSRRIIGYCASDNMFVINNQEALKMVFKTRKQVYFENLVHHSDKGSQYGAKVYVSMLESANIRISMAETCLENPYAERINGIIKNDYLIAYHICTLQQLKRALPKAIKLYNNYPHGKLKLKSPLEFENILGKLDEVDCPVMKLYDFTK